jgi:hypothetical protein
MPLSTLHATSDKGAIDQLSFSKIATNHDHRQHQVSSATAAATTPRSILLRTLPRMLFVKSGWTKKLKPRSSKLQSVRVRSAKCLLRTPLMRTIVSWYWTSLTSLRAATLLGRAEARKLELGEHDLNGTALQLDHELGPSEEEITCSPHCVFATSGLQSFLDR